MAYLTQNMYLSFSINVHKTLLYDLRVDMSIHISMYVTLTQKLHRQYLNVIKTI